MDLLPHAWIKEGASALVCDSDSVGVAIVAVRVVVSPMCGFDRGEGVVLVSRKDVYRFL